MQCFVPRNSSSGIRDIQGLSMAHGRWPVMCVWGSCRCDICCSNCDRVVTQCAPSLLYSWDTAKDSWALVEKFSLGPPSYTTSLYGSSHNPPVTFRCIIGYRPHWIVHTGHVFTWKLLLNKIYICGGKVMQLLLCHRYIAYEQLQACL